MSTPLLTTVDVDAEEPADGANTARRPRFSQRLGGRAAIGLFCLLVVLAFAAPRSNHSIDTGGPPDGPVSSCDASTPGDLSQVSSYSLSMTTKTAFQAAPKVKAYPSADLMNIFKDASLRQLDVDGDGKDDLRWTVDPLDPNQPAYDPMQTNVADLWSTLGGVIDANNPAIAARVRFERLPSDPVIDANGDAAADPMSVSAGLTLTFQDPQTQAISTIAIKGGYDSIATSSLPPTEFTTALVLQDKPPAKPTSLVAGAHLAATFRLNGNPNGAVIASGSQPKLRVDVSVGTEAKPDETLTVGTTFSRMPAQYAAGLIATCDPNGSTARVDSELSESAPGQAPVVGVAAPDLTLQVAAGNGHGLSGKPEVDVLSTIAHLPERLTVDFGPSAFRIAHSKRDGTPSPVKPDLILDHLLIATKNPAVSNQLPLLAEGKLQALPRFTRIDAAGQNGTPASLDLRFCDDEWGTPTCAQTLEATGETRIVISDLFPGQTTTLPDVPADKAFVSVAIRDKYLPPVNPNMPATPDKHFRVGVGFTGMKHVRMQPATTGGAAYEPDMADQGVEVTTEMDGNVAARLQANVDTLHSVLVNGGPKPQSKLVGSAFGFDGTLTPLPSKMHVRLSPTDDAPVDVAYDMGGTSPSLHGAAFYDGGADTDELQVRAKVQVGPEGGGLPDQARIRYEKLPKEGGMYDPPSYQVRVQTPADKTSHVVAGLTVTTSADRAKAVNKQLRGWADVRMRGDLAVKWKRDLTGNIVRLTAGPGCPDCVSTNPSADLFPDIRARVVRQPIPNPREGGSSSDLLLPPDLPDRQFTDRYPAFTPMQRGAHVVVRDDDTWGAGVSVAHLQSVRYENVDKSKGQEVCVQTNSGGSETPPVVDPGGTRPGGRPEPEPATAPFGARVFVNVHESKAPAEPVFVDGALSQLPKTLDFRINEKAAAGDDNANWLWVNTKACNGTDAPAGDPTQDTGIGLAALVKVGRADAQALLTAEPNVPGSLKLSKPTLNEKPATKVQGITDSSAGAAFDVSARLTVPDHLVVRRPKVTLCDSSTPATEIELCQARHVWERDQIIEAGLSFRSTLETLGPLDVSLRQRSPLAPTSPGDPDPTCTVDKICRRDIDAHVDSVPGMLDANAKVTLNQRITKGSITATVANAAANPTQGLGQVALSLRDEQHPAKTSAPDNKVVPLAALTLANVGPMLTANAEFQMAESVPGSSTSCGKNIPPSLGYVHADLVLSPGTDTVNARVRQDWDGKAYARVFSGDGKPMQGDVRAKVNHLALGVSRSEWDAGQLFAGMFFGGTWLPGPWYWESSDLNICIDADLPVQLQFSANPDARLALDLAQVELNSPKGGALVMNFGERFSNGSFKAGYFAHKKTAYYDPTGPAGVFDDSTADDVWQNMDAIILDQEDPAPPLEFFGDNSTVQNTITTGGGQIRFLIDPIFSQTNRDSMRGWDDDAAYTALPGHPRPGDTLYRGIWNMGHRGFTGPTEMGNLQKNAAVDTGWQTKTMNVSNDEFPDELEKGNDPELSAYRKSTGVIAQGPDGTKYQVYMGNILHGNNNGWNPISLDATYENNRPRWRRYLGEGYGFYPTPMTANGLNACGGYRDSVGVWHGVPCKLTVSLRVRETGLIDVKWTLVRYPGMNEESTRESGDWVFDPSGHGGPLGFPTPLDKTGTAGLPTPGTSITPFMKFSGVYDYESKYKVVVSYGDGRVVEHPVTNSFSVKGLEDHTYPATGDYPAIVTFYQLAKLKWGDSSHTEKWLPTAAVPVKIHQN